MSCIPGVAWPATLVLRVLCSRSLCAGVLLAAAVLGAACRENDDPEGAQELLARVNAENFRGWRRAPGYEVRRPSGAPHGNDVDIYVNAVVGDTLDGPAGTSVWPEGSVIVKEGFDRGRLELTAVMEKRADGWYWAEYDSDGEPLYSGRPDVCTDCHSRGADFVRAFDFPK